jgi:hypothetical protein
VAHGIEEALDIRVQHPVHRFPVDPGMEGVQRVVLAPPREYEFATDTSAGGLTVAPW